VAKERVFYNEEKLKQQKRIDIMVAKDPEDYEIKKQVQLSVPPPSLAPSLPVRENGSG